jgi:Xaa-Pro aminopeptidase
MNWLTTAQSELQRLELDGWLIYDFRGLNRIARRFLQIGPGMLTRRVFLFVPARGEATLLVHSIERGSLYDLPLQVASYTSHESLRESLAGIVPAGRVALEYSPGNDIPYLSFVDAGTMEMIRSLGVTPVSSGDLLQVFSAWTPAQKDAHRQAAAHALTAKDEAFGFIARQTAAGIPVRETDVQNVISTYFTTHHLEFDHPAIVGFAGNAGNPHYAPQAGSDRTLQPHDAILIDLWCKLPGADNPYADITWTGSWGEPTPEHQRIFEIVRDARDLGVRVIEDAFAAGRVPEGREVDRAVRDFITSQGYGAAFTHRTGHSIGLDATHGDAAHLDDFETRDTRRLIPGIAVTIEPGIYLDHLGVRSEINLIIGEDGPEVTTDEQRDLIVTAI